MKKTFVLFCAICPLFLLAQTVNHFENESSRWFVAESYATDPQNSSFMQTLTTVYGFQGDSLVGGESWFKMFSTPDSSFSTDLVYEGLVRSSNGHVLFQDISNEIDTIYNFNLELGDSVLYSFENLMPEYIEVINVDSIEINGEMYRQLYFDEPQPQVMTSLLESWVDGIGSIHAPLFPSKPKVFDNEIFERLDLTCSHSNDVWYWESSFYDNCVVNIILDVENAETSNFDIYPNPATQQIFIRQEQTRSGHFVVRDIIGKNVLSGSLLSDNQPVDISQLNDGIYVVTVLLDETTLTKKILKY